MSGEVGVPVIRKRRLVNWVALLLAMVPIPFALRDAAMLRIWKADWQIQLVSLGFVVATCIFIYAIVCTVFWVTAKLRTYIFPIGA